MLSQVVKLAKLDGYKTYFGAAAVALAAFAGILGDEHSIIQGVEIIFGALAGVGLGHKLDKARQSLEL